MKEFCNIQLQNAKKLEKDEMKKILGGRSICPDDKPYIFRCSNGNLICCMYDDEVGCCTASEKDDLEQLT